MSYSARLSDADRQQADSAEHPSVRHDLDIPFLDSDVRRASHDLQVQIRLRYDRAEVGSEHL